LSYLLLSDFELQMSLRFRTARAIKFWDLILALHHHNNCTTSHMKVDPSVWDTPSCEGLLCSCCIGVVNLTFSLNFLLRDEYYDDVGLIH
jgi:hypothetical protein